MIHPGETVDGGSQATVEFLIGRGATLHKIYLRDAIAGEEGRFTHFHSIDLSNYARIKELLVAAGLEIPSKED